MDSSDIMTQPTSTSRSDREAVITTPVTVPYRRYSIRNAHWFCAQALARLLKDASLKKQELDGLCVGSFGLAPDTAIGLTQHLGVTLRWLDYLPIGGACGIVALRRAMRAVEAGDAEVVACMGADSNHTDSFRQSLASFSVFARDAVFPYGSGGPNASFAFLTQFYMRTYGATREDFGRICIAQRDNALGFKHALFSKPLSMKEYLAARVIADPIHLFDCVMPCAGAEGFLVMTRARAEKLRRGFWTETLTWVWRFNKDQTWLKVDFEKGKYFQSGELRYLGEAERYQFTVLTTANTTNAFPAGPLRPNLLRDAALPADQRTLARWFDTGAFANPAPLTFGNAPRSGLRAAPVITTDATLEKSFSITERFRFEVRGELYNLLNHAIFNVPGFTLGAADFGVVSSARAPRTAQVAMRPPYKSSSTRNRSKSRLITVTRAPIPTAIRTADVPTTPAPITTTWPGKTPGTPANKTPRPPCTVPR